MVTIAIFDVTDVTGFALVPPCADPGFDHRSCDYWENERGSKAARLAWLEEGSESPPTEPRRRLDPFGGSEDEPPAVNPFAPRAASSPPLNPFLSEGQVADNPFAPARRVRPGLAAGAPRKLQLLGRGLGVFGSYAKVLVVDDAPAAYCQFGPLSAYPRAQRLRDLYSQLPVSPLPAVVTCISTTAEARRLGYATRLVAAVTADLGERGFAAVEAYPEQGAEPDATSAASPGFWLEVGFAIAVDDPRFPVMRREL